MPVTRRQLSLLYVGRSARTRSSCRPWRVACLRPHFPQASSKVSPRPPRAKDLTLLAHREVGGVVGHLDPHDVTVETRTESLSGVRVGAHVGHGSRRRRGWRISTSSSGRFHGGQAVTDVATSASPPMTLRVGFGSRGAQPGGACTGGSCQRLLTLFRAKLFLLAVATPDVKIGASARSHGWDAVGRSASAAVVRRWFVADHPGTLAASSIHGRRRVVLLAGQRRRVRRSR